TNFTNWTSGNEKINSFIQERQLKINKYDDTVLEWIPYNQFNEIKKTGNTDLITVYSAIWKDGPLYKEAFQALYGISQNPDTGDYIFVQNYIINLVNWISENEKIDDIIHKRQLRINGYYYNDIVFEWISYNQFNEIKETSKNDFITVYSAIWKDGPLFYDKHYENYARDLNKEIVLKCFHNSQESIDSLINEANKYLRKNEGFHALYGISQNPDTGDYIFVQNNHLWTSGNEKINDFIQKRQLKIKNYDDTVLEWIPYNQLNEIKETGKNGLITVYSAIWKNGPLHYNFTCNKYTRDSNKEVALKCLHNSQESVDSLINKAEKYPTKHKAFQVLYGISQNPDTGDYILVLIWTSGNDKVDDFIQERQLKINDYNDVVFEWIPYSQFDNIKEIGKGGFSTVYSAEWKNGPLEYDVDIEIYNRNPNRVIALRYLHNSQSITDKFLNEVKEYSINKSTTGRQPFGNRAHDYGLALDICKGIRPEISEPEAPRYYTDLMKKCWDLDKNNRSNILEVDESITSFHELYGEDFFTVENEEIEIQFREAEEYRRANLSSTENYQIVTHPQAIYRFRLLNPFTEDLPKYDDDYNS
ncbi:hypothetical protein RhiirC2_795941, partial [Rhizophagus irregularis]